MTAASYVAPARRRLARLSPRARRRAVTAHRATLTAALSGAPWRCERALRTVTDISAYAVRGADGRAGVLKVATTRSGIAGLRRERAVLDQLRADQRLGRWRTLLPVPLDAGNAGPGAFLVTSRLPGVDGRELPAPADQLTAAAVEAISPLHRLTAAVQRIDNALLDRWVDQPGERIARAVSAGGAIGRLTERLRADLLDRPVTLGWVHGDLHPGNLLVSPDRRVTGIVDWGEACVRDLPTLDLAFWLLTVDSCGGQAGEFGERVAARLSDGPLWTPAESRLLQGVTGVSLTADRTLLLLAWLRHVASNLVNTNCAGNLPWLRRNVMVVLRQVTRG